MSILKPIRGPTRLIEGHPLTRNFKGWWRLDEGTGVKIFDSSGHQANYLGDLFGGVVWKAGKESHALYFNGGDDIAKLQLWNGGPKVTFFARVKFEEAIGTVEQITAADSNFSGPRTFQFRRSTAGKLDFLIFVGGIVKQVIGDTTLTTGVWWDVAAVNDGVNVHVFVNGVEDATPVASGNMDNDQAAWAIGGRPGYVDWSNIYNDLQGRIEFLMRWDDALLPASIALLHQNPSCIVQKPTPVYFFAAPVGEVKELTGLVEGESVVTGALKVGQKITGTVTSESSVTGSIEVSSKITGAVGIQSVVSGSIKVVSELIGTIDVQSSVSGNLVVPAGGFSNLAENKILELITGKTPYAKPTIYIGFCTADPGEEATGGNCNEVPNTNGYARVATAAGDWNVASSGAIDNANAFTTPFASGGAWGEITHFVLIDSETYGEGNVLVYDELDTVKTIDEDDILQFNAGDLSLTLD